MSEVLVDSKKYHFPVVIDKENNSYGIHVVGLEGIFSAGPTFEDAKKKAAQAIQQHLASLSPEELQALEPYTSEPQEVKVEVLSVVHPPENHG